MAEKLTFGGVLDLETRAATARLKAIEGQARDSFRNIKVDFNSAPLKAGSAALGRIRRDADQFEKSMEAANARVLAFGTAVGVIEGMRRSFLALIKTTADVETALTKISIVAGSDLEKTGTTIEKVGKQIFNVAKQTGQTFAVASEAYLELSRQGLGLSQSLERTKVSLDVVRASGAEHSKVISGLTAAYNAFSDTGLTYTQIAEKIANVDAKTTTSYEGLLDVLSRASSTARQTGTSFEELLAVTSTLKDLTARSESVIGNAFRSISTRLLDPKILENLQSLYNIDTRALDTGALLKPVEILTNVSNKLREISDPSQRNEIVKSISGLYQADQLNALIKALSDASNLQGIYQKNLRASTEESDVLARSSKKFADTLNNQFAVLGVQLTEILNSFGKLGLAEPLSNLLNTISGLAENLKGAAENTDFLSQGFQTIVKVLGGALFSKAGLAAIGFVIGKIAKDFIAFGLEAGRSFLGLNKAARDQAAIQQSIAAYIQQSGQNLNVLLNSEQARLNLTKQIAAAWNQSVLSAQQMAAVTKQIAVPIFNSGLRVGASGPTRKASEGFMPLVNAEMNDVKRGVGGASPSSKIVVMPNFPFGGGKRGTMVANSSETLVDYGGGKFGIMNPDMMMGRAAEGDFPSSLSLSSTPVALKTGKFAPVKKIESALNQTISNFLDLGNGTKGLYQEIQKTLKQFQLTGTTFKEVAVAANDYARNLVKNKEEAKKAYEQEVILNNQRRQQQETDRRIQLAKEESLRKAQASNALYATSSVASMTPFVGLGFAGARLASSGSSYSSSFQPSAQAIAARQSSNSIYGSVGSANTSFYGGNLNSPIDIFGVNKTEPVSSLTATTKGFDQDAFNAFAAKAFIGIAALEGITSAARGTSESLDKFLDITNKAAFALTGIAALQQFSSINLFGGLGKLLGGLGQGGGKLASIFAPLFSLGKGLVRFVPVVGQLGIGLTLVNSVIEDLTGKSGLQRLKEAFGGLTEEAERSAQAFKENAESMFDASGNPIGKSGLEVRQGFSARLEAAKREREARKLGIDVTGKTQQQLAAETFGKRLDSLIGGSKTGAKTVRQRFANSSITGPNAAPSIIFETIDETLGNINSSIPEIIKDNLQILANQTEDGLRELLASKGVAKIDGQDLKDAGLEKLQEETINLFLQNIQRNLESVKKAAEVGRAGELIGNLGLIFTNLPAKTSSRSFSGSIAEKPEDVKKLLEFQQEIIGLTIDGSISGLESQIKLLDIAGQDQLLSAKSREIIAQKQQQLQEKIVDEALSKNAINFITQSEILKNSGLSEPEQKQELAKLQISFENQKRAAEESKKAILEEGNARRKAANDLEKLSQSIGSVQTALNAIAIDRSVIQGNITRLQAKGGDPTLGILSQENIQRQIANQQRLDLEKSKEELFKSLDIREKEIRSTTPSDKLKQALDDLATERTRELEAINANIDALEIETSQIGSIKSARQELEDSLLEFSRSFGRDRAQNQFNLLQSTDPQSRIGGLISEQVFNQSGNKTGSELVSFISDQNALLLEQSKIRTAANASEKLELETQYELTKQILEIKKQGLSPLEEQLKIEQAINANLKDRQTFGFGVRQASAEAQTRMQNFSSDFGKTAFDGFRDGLSDAIKAAVSQTDNLKSALLDVALAFANKLRDKAIDNLADVISNSLFSGGQSKSSGGGIVSGIVSAIGGFFGGGVQKRATGGMVTGGTGKKDDVPTLLMGGEYVVPKNIVRQYGKGFFDRLRDGSVGKMAQGGYFAPGIRGQGTISGKENLLDFATQTATSGKGDLISSLSANAGLVSLEPESLRLTNFARFGDSPLVAATQDAKDQAFQLYLGQLEDEKAYAEYQAQLKKAEKEKKKQLWTSLAIAAVGAGLNYYGFGQQTASKSKETAFSGGKIRRTSERPNLGGSAQETAKGSYLSGLFKATAYGLSSIDPTTAMDQSKANAGIRGYKGFSQTVGASGRKLIPGFSVASNYFPQGTMLSINGQTFRVDDTGGMSKNIIDFFAGGDRGLYQKYSNWGGVRVTPIGRNSGGYSMGNGDTIPTMLSQDEFVLNKSATRKIGDKNLYALNNGAMPSGDNGSSAVVVAKLDELIEKTIGASNVTVNVTMNGGEEKSSNQNSDGQGDQNPRMLVQRIKEVVIGVIRDEQRPGGSLTKTR